MPADWDNVSVDQAHLESIDPYDMDATADPDADIMESARRLVRSKVTASVPNDVLNVGSGIDAFFDKVADNADAGEDLEDEVNNMIGYAYLHIHAQGGSTGPGSRLAEAAAYYEQQLEDSVAAFANVVGVVLGTRSNSPQEPYVAGTEASMTSAGGTGEIGQATVDPSNVQ